MIDTQVATIAGTLAMHYQHTGFEADGVKCSCGERFPDGFMAYRRHVAEAIYADVHADLEHAGLHGAIAEVLADGGPINDELDAAASVMDLLVLRRLIPPPVGYTIETIPCPECHGAGKIEQTIPGVPAAVATKFVVCERCWPRTPDGSMAAWSDGKAGKIEVLRG